MKKGDHKISITKSGDTWKCSLRKLLNNRGNAWELIDFVLANSFSELMVEIGNKQWVDIINKNS